MLGLTQEQKAKIVKIMKAQLDETGWNFYNERQHVETLFYNRFNFFLVLYGMFVAAVTGVEYDSLSEIYTIIAVSLLIFGIVILTFVGITLCRNYQTLRMILYILDNGLPEYHSSPILSSYMKRGCLNIPSSGYFISMFIPIVCLMSLYGFLWYIIEMGPVDIPCFLECIGHGAIIVSFLFYFCSVGIVLYWTCGKRLKESLDSLEFETPALKMEEVKSDSK